MSCRRSHKYRHCDHQQELNGAPNASALACQRQSLLRGTAHHLGTPPAGCVGTQQTRKRAHTSCACACPVSNLEVPVDATFKLKPAKSLDRPTVCSTTAFRHVGAHGRRGVAQVIEPPPQVGRRLDAGENPNNSVKELEGGQLSSKAPQSKLKLMSPGAASPRCAVGDNPHCVPSVTVVCRLRTFRAKQLVHRN